MGPVPEDAGADAGLMVAMRVCRALVAGLVWVLVMGASGAAVDGSRGGHSSWRWPLEPVPSVLRSFERPTSPYGSGHRGVDLAGDVGQQVLAIGDGIVSFAGPVAGRGVVVVDHGGLRSTYEPVTAGVPVGTAVSAGQVVGFLQLLHSHCLPEACLHLGVRRGDAYLDPLSLLGARPIRLKPLDGLVDGSRPSVAADGAEPPRGQRSPVQLMPFAGAPGATIGLAASQARG